MNRYFFDSYAIIEMIKDNPAYYKFKVFGIITNVLNISEVYYSLLKGLKEMDANKVINALDIQIINIDKECSINAAKFRFENKGEGLSYADCIGYITSLKEGLVFLTGDEKFKNMKNVEFVK